MSWTPLFNEIVTSSIWTESNEVRVLWITMLAMKDRYGEVMASVPGLARIAGLSLEETEGALKVLESPDPHSRNKANEGRRIKAVQGGWAILNFETYRQKVSQEMKRERDRKAQERRRKMGKNPYRTLEDKLSDRE